MPQTRLQKIISQSGLLSRRAAEKAIEAGEVTVNGKVIRELGSTADPEVDEIRVNDTLVQISQEKVVYLLNKPREVMTTKSDPEGRKTVMDLIPSSPSVHPVGRLDYQSEGLLLLTNDGDLTFHLTHPKFEVEKIYHCKVKGNPSQNTLKTLMTSVSLDDGPGRFTEVKLLKEAENPLLEVRIHEGRNRFIRRMFETVGHPVLRLKRVQLGPLKLGDLKPGDFKKLSAQEIKGLHAFLNPSH